MSYKKNFIIIEEKWVKIWKKLNPAYCNLDSNKPKFYSLGMFVYPSGSGLHAGHPKNYFPLDAICRYKKMNGFEVLNPMGFDAFGLPAEQHARKTGKNPQVTIKESIKRFKNQFWRLGMFFDWSKEINTSSPDYYKITQWCFLRLYEAGYAKRVFEPVIWCEKLGTVLAKEETKIKDGIIVSEIGEFPVQKRKELQWVMDIKKDSILLLSSFNNKSLLDWPKDVIEQQINWIGELKLQSLKLRIEEKEVILFSFCSWKSIKNPLLYIAKNSPLYSYFLNKSNKKKISFLSRIKTKINFYYYFFTTTLLIKNISKKVKIILVNRETILNEIENLLIEEVKISNQLNLLFLGGREYDYLFPKLIEFSKSFKLDKVDIITYRIRNWVFSRQRYWGEPIPIIYDENKNPHPLNVDELPLILPKVENYKPKKNHLTVLETMSNWMKVTKNHINYTRECFTMPQWAGSSWYHLAYLLKNGNSFFSITSEKAKKRFKKWLPVDLYIGGKEHTVLHLIYARFWHHVLFQEYGVTSLLKKVVPTKEPFFKLVNHGMVLNEDGKKMSKSKGIGIDPLVIANKYGADAYRLFLLFSVPIKEQTKLVLHDIKIMQNWLNRVWRLVHNIALVIENYEKLENEYYLMIKKCSKAIEDLKLNVAISFLMHFINQCYRLSNGYITKEFVKGFLQILHCFAPFISQELYSKLIKNEIITNTKWPACLDKNLTKFNCKIAIQINGKLRGVLNCKKNLKEKNIYELALKTPKIKKYIENKKIIKKIYIKNKILSLVVKDE